MEKDITTITSPLGDIEVDREAILVFPEGLPGFEQLTQFIIVTLEKYIPFQFMQSLENPEVSFPIIRPELFHPDFHPRISDFELRAIRLKSVAEAEIYSIATVGEEPCEVTVNLRAPLLVNRSERLGKQCILADESYDLRYPVLTSNDKKSRKAATCSYSPEE